jgi:uncharacterized protein YprB with RNaseH-like and TPR domain
LSNWHIEALKLRVLGWSSRKIGKHLGKGKSSVNDLFKRLDSGAYSPTQIDTLGLDKVEVKGPKILFIDIETKPILAHVWRLFDQNVGLNQIQEDWSILSYCAKWKGSDDVIYEDLQGSDDFEDDSRLLGNLWKLLNEADIVVGQNSKRFDVKKINARLVLNGYPKPSTFRQIDTLNIAKAQFGFTSNKLQYMTDQLCTRHKKLEHGKFAGHMLWAECMKNNPEAWAEMKLYNVNDVLSLEELYDILSSWDNTLPNFDVYVDEILDMSVWEEDGYHYSNLGKYKRYRNKITGVQRRSRVNLLTKEKRESLLSNITS